MTTPTAAKAIRRRSSAFLVTEETMTTASSRAITWKRKYRRDSILLLERTTARATVRA